jgi:chromosome segregation ATPase
MAKTEENARAGKNPTTMSRESSLLLALDESKQALKEMVDEVVFLEQEAARYKSSNTKLLAALEESRAAHQAAKSSQQDLVHANASLKARVAEYESGNAVRSLKQMLLEQRDLFKQQQQPNGSSPSLALSQSAASSPMHDRRLASLERLCAEERLAREHAEQGLAQTLADLERAQEDLKLAVVRTSMTKGEADTERDHRRDLREEFVRVQRNNEAAVREQRASEKRFEAILEELRQVMEERDVAVASREEARYDAGRRPLLTAAATAPHTQAIESRGGARHAVVQTTSGRGPRFAACSHRTRRAGRARTGPGLGAEGVRGAPARRGRG